MKAYQLTRWRADGELRDVPVLEPQAGQVLVKIGGAGACHSDLHFMDANRENQFQPPWHLPFTLGHKNAGWVERIGAGVIGLRPVIP